MAKSKQSVSNMARGRFGMLVLLFAAGALALAFKLFAAAEITFMQFSLTAREGDAFGWMLIIISLMASCVALYLALTMTSE